MDTIEIKLRERSYYEKAIYVERDSIRVSKHTPLTIELEILLPGNSNDLYETLREFKDSIVTIRIIQGKIANTFDVSDIEFVYNGICLRCHNHQSRGYVRRVIKRKEK